jgi:hypothetical protein
VTCAEDVVLLGVSSHTSPAALMGKTRMEGLSPTLGLHNNKKRNTL